MKTDHPYKAFEELEVWGVLRCAIDELEANGDLEKTTAMPYIVGYLTQRLLEAGVVAEPNVQRATRAAQ